MHVDSLIGVTLCVCRPPSQPRHPSTPTSPCPSSSVRLCAASGRARSGHIGKHLASRASTAAAHEASAPRNGQRRHGQGETEGEREGMGRICYAQIHTHTPGGRGRRVLGVLPVTHMQTLPDAHVAHLLPDPPNSNEKLINSKSSHSYYMFYKPCTKDGTFC